MKEPRDELVLGQPKPEPSKQYGCLHRHFPKPNKNIVPLLMRRHKKNTEHIFLYSETQTPDNGELWHSKSTYSKFSLSNSFAVCTH